MSAKHVHLSEHPGYSSLGIFQTHGRREEYTDLEANRRPSRAGGGCEFCLPRGIRDELTGTEIRIGTCTDPNWDQQRVRRAVMRLRTIIILAISVLGVRPTTLQERAVQLPIGSVVDGPSPRSMNA